MELPELPVVLNWIFKLLLITALIYLGRKFSPEIKESEDYFRFEVWISVMIGMVIMVAALQGILFYDNHAIGDQITRVVQFTSKSLMSLLLVLIAGRIVYKKVKLKYRA